MLLIEKHVKNQELCLYTDVRILNNKYRLNPTAEKWNNRGEEVARKEEAEERKNFGMQE